MSVKNVEFEMLVEKFPELLEKDFPTLEGKIEWVEHQIEEYKKIMFRIHLDFITAKHFIEKNDPFADEAAIKRMHEITLQGKSIKWTLEVLNIELQKLKAEAEKAA